MSSNYLSNQDDTVLKTKMKNQQTKNTVKQNLGTTQDLGIASDKLKTPDSLYLVPKMILCALLIILSTLSVQSRMQYYGPFARIVQCYFNYHILEHESQDIYEAADVIYYRTQEYHQRGRILGFYDKYVQGLQGFFNDSLFVQNKSSTQGQESDNPQVVLTAIYANKSSLESIDLVQGYQNDYAKVFRSKLTELRQLFSDTTFNRQFYSGVQKITLSVDLPAVFRNESVWINLFTTITFKKLLLMTVKLETKVFGSGFMSRIHPKQNQSYFNSEPGEEQLSIRKLSTHMVMSLDLKHAKWLLFGIASLIFILELVVVLLRNREVSAFQKHSNFDPLITYSGRNALEETDITLSERLERIGYSNVLQLWLSFLTLVSIQQQGLVCLFCWTKVCVYFSRTGNRLMLGYLFRRALPIYLKVMLNLAILLSAFVFFSMIVYRSTNKFEGVQLSFYEYLFNYFQYGIYENFMPIRQYGFLYSGLYFAHMIFLVSVGNNILQSLLAQQVLKNSNMKALTELIEGIQVQCPVCGSSPEVKKRVNVNLNHVRQSESQLISKYFNHKEEEDQHSKGYDIQIVSPRFSPMFHREKLTKRQFGRPSQNTISSRQQTQQCHSDQNLGINPSPLRSDKKIKFELGQAPQIKISKFEQFEKRIKLKAETLNKILSNLVDVNEARKNSTPIRRYVEQLGNKLAKVHQIKNSISIRAI